VLLTTLSHYERVSFTLIDTTRVPRVQHDSNLFNSLSRASVTPLVQQVEHQQLFPKQNSKAVQSLELAVKDCSPELQTTAIKHRESEQPSPGDTAWFATLRTWQVSSSGSRIGSCQTSYSNQGGHVQDERRRHFLGRLPELQPRYRGPVSVGQLDTAKPVFATFTNAAPVYVEQLLNWAFHLRELHLPHLVVCLDNESEDIARSNGIPWVAVQNKTTSEDVRNDHAVFRAMVSRKVHLKRAAQGTSAQWASSLVHTA
jgi:hypothetical protein